MVSPRVAPLVLLALAAASACASTSAPPATSTPPPHATPSSPPTDPVPTLRLPSDTRPLSERLELSVDPAQPGFRGTADIVVQLDHPRRVVWLHGRDFHVSAATATPEGGAAIPATWEERDKHGTSALTLASELPAGKATLHLAFDAPYPDGRTGLYHLSAAGNAYAFTQFAPIDARRAFPCFDEPEHKIPFGLTLDVPAGMEAIANTPEAERTTAKDGTVRVRFADTKPIPSYLVALAVGPLDVVAAPDVPPNEIRQRPLPFRGVATKGRGKELAYAMAHGGELLALLERYFGTEYPYEKLDLIAVPEKVGAMENAGAITSSEPALLFDASAAPPKQKAWFAEVVAHEISHQWFGDLVTMTWWNDAWLNEAFATWVAGKIDDEWNPAVGGKMDVLTSTQEVMEKDSLVSVRSIREPIATTEDIDNAFDGITYNKGAGVLTMFERWLGEDTFRAGVRLHMAQHRYGSATADDFLSALSSAAKRDVAGPFHTFLDQPGVPYLETELRCDGAEPPHVHLKQSRFLPLGSQGDANKVWSIPVCARYEEDGASKEACTLLADREGDLPLGSRTCPAWVLPNADAAGYYRFEPTAKDLAALRTAGPAKLGAREKAALVNSVQAAFDHGTTSFADALRMEATFAGDADPDVAHQASELLTLGRDWLFADKARPTIEAVTRQTYAPALAKLGWTSRKEEEPTTALRRSQTILTLAQVGRDPAVRAEAKKRARAFLGFGGDGKLHPEAVDPSLTAAVLAIAGEDADPRLFDAILAQLEKAKHEELRHLLVRALGFARAPALARRVRDLTLDPRIHVTEVLSPLSLQLATPELQDEAWTWMKEHFDALAPRATGNMFGGMRLFRPLGGFCDDAHAKDIAAFLTERAKTIDGGPRGLASALEEINLCVAKRAVQEKGARDYFAHGAK